MSLLLAELSHHFERCAVLSNSAGVLLTIRRDNFYSWQPILEEMNSLNTFLFSGSRHLHNNSGAGIQNSTSTAKSSQPPVYDTIPQQRTWKNNAIRY